MSIHLLTRYGLSLGGSGGPAIQVIGTTTLGHNDTSQATSHVVPLPEGYAAGDLLVLCVSSQSAPVAPDGWSEDTFNNSNRNLFWRYATGGEGETVTFTTSIASRRAVNAYAIRGVAGTPQAQTAVGVAAYDFAPEGFTDQPTIWIGGILAPAGYDAFSIPSSFTDPVHTYNALTTATNRRQALSAHLITTGASIDVSDDPFTLRDPNPFTADPFMFGVQAT